jgi:HPt (histidine-containing phosphotransfer) domain-containing protein
MSAVLNTLPDELPGFDLYDALGRLGHNQALMILLLQRFVQEYESAACRVVSLIQEKQPEKAAFLLHKVQGACLMIGATQLAECAQQLETEVESGMPSLPLFEQKLNDACRTIKAVVTV